MHTRGIGANAEEAAVNFITQLGWKVIERNSHYRFGEIDILADNSETLILIEVKAKKSASHGLAVEMLTYSKQKTLLKLAKWVQSKYNKPVRIDVITIDNFTGRAPEIVHYPNAIGE
jgi:putative endonuclease